MEVLFLISLFKLLFPKASLVFLGGVSFFSNFLGVSPKCFSLWRAGTDLVTSQLNKTLSIKTLISFIHPAFQTYQIQV